MADYLLTFDFSEFTRQMSDVNKSYTDFGAAMRQMMSAVSTNLTDLQKQADTFSTSINKVSMDLDTTYSLLNLHMQESVHILEDIARHGKDIASAMSGAGGGKPGGVSQIADIYPHMAENAEGSAKLAAETEKTLAAVVASVGKLSKELAEFKAGTTETIKDIGGIVEKELKNAGKQAGSAISSMFPVSFGGGLLAGLIGAMIFGVEYTQKVGAETGEIKNIFAASFSGLGDAATKKAMDWFGGESGFQERAKKFYGIGIKETQAAISGFVDAGYASEQFMRTFKKGLGEVGNDLPTMTLALEKHLNLATGSAARNINKMVADFGDTLGQAADKFYKLSFAAQSSGMGISKFIDSVMAGSQAMAQYGIEIEDVAQVMSKLEKHYKEMGLTNQYAGTQAGAALGTVAQGMAGMSDPFTAMLAKERYQDIENPLEASQKYRRGWQRVAEGEDEGFFIQEIKHIVEVARRETGNNAPAMIEYLKTYAGWKEQYIPAIIEMAPTLKEGVKLDAVRGKQLEAFKNSFKTEGETLTALQKNQNELIQEMAALGKSLLKIVSGLLGTVVVGLASIGRFLQAMTLPEDQRAEAFNEILSALKTQTDTIKSGLGEIPGESGKLLESVFKTVGTVFGPNVASAFDFAKDSLEKVAGISGKDVAAGAGRAILQGGRNAFLEGALEMNEKEVKKTNFIHDLIMDEVKDLIKPFMDWREEQLQKTEEQRKAAVDDYLNPNRERGVGPFRTGTPNIHGRLYGTSAQRLRVNAEGVIPLEHIQAAGNAAKAKFGD